MNNWESNSTFSNTPNYVLYNGNTLASGAIAGTNQTTLGGLAKQGDYFYDPSGQHLYIDSATNPASYYSSIGGSGGTPSNIDTNGQSYLSISGLQMQYASTQALYLDGASTNVTASGNNISATPTGVLQSSASAASSTIEYNTIQNVNYCWQVTGGSTTAFYNNTCSGAATSNFYINSSNITQKNNIFYGGYGTPTYSGDVGTGAASGLSFDYNLYDKTTTARLLGLNSSILWDQSYDSTRLTNEINSLSAMGAQAVHLEISPGNWDWVAKGFIESAPGTYNWTMLDQVVNGYVAKGIKVVMEISPGSPTWLNGNSNVNGVDATIPDGGNLITNPGFEMASFSGWTQNVGNGSIIQDSSTPDTVAGITSVYDAKLTSGSSANTYVSQTVTVVPGQLYHLMFTTHGDYTNSGQYQVYDNIHSTNIIAPTSTNYSGTVSFGEFGGYRNVSTYFTAPSGCTSVTLSLYGPPANGGYAQFDNVFLIPILTNTFTTFVNNYASFASALVTHYQNSVTRWEIGNEEDTSAFWMPVPDVRQYAAWYIAIHDAIKAVQPNATVASGGFATEVFPYGSTVIIPSNSIAYGGANGFLSTFYSLVPQAKWPDAVAIHNYPGDPSITTPYQANWADIAAVRSAETTSGSSAPMWITEAGWPGGLGQTSTQASYTDYALNSLATTYPYITLATLWQAEDGTDNMGFYSVSGDTLIPKPVAFTFAKYNGAEFLYQGTSELLPTWAASVGGESHSFMADPTFTNGSGSYNLSNDFALQSSSPAIDTGLNLGAMYEWGLDPVSTIVLDNQNSNGIGWDLGAYVYTQTSTPSISITTPLNLATVSSTITLSASSSAITPASIASVQFYLDGSPLGSAVTSSPYAISWNTGTTTNGNHTLYAMATDNYSNIASSTSITVTVLNQAVLLIPTSTLNFSAVQGSTATSSQTVIVSNAGSVGTTLNWSASSTQTWLTFSPASGSVAGNASTSISFIANPTDLAIGTYNATATIADPNASSSPQSIPVSLTISTTGIGTTLLSPTNGATVTSTVSLSSAATSTVGIASVHFYLDGSPLGSAVTSSPYTISWNTGTATDGSHTLYSQATDNNSNIASSSEITITVDNTPPAISITSPTSGATVSGTTSITASSSDALSGVSSVAFYLDGSLLGESTSSQYSIDWDTTQTSNASHNITAIATDGVRNATTSQAIPVTVYNAPPVSSGGGGGGGSVQSDIAIVKTVDQSAPATGATIHYMLTVSDGGPSDSSAVVASDTLPTGVTFNSASSSEGSYASSTGIWTIGTIPNGHQATLVITATVTAAGGTIITNTGTVSENPGILNATPQDDTSRATITVAGGGVTSSSPSSTLSALSGMTVGEMESLLASLETELQALEAQVGNATISSPYVFTSDLQLHDTGPAVNALQRYLIREDTGPAATKLKIHGATNYFGILTYNALVEFQASVGIHATGYFGPITRAWVNGHE
jgi:uncharacterized repeat protein (TIGR01451 family)